MEELRASGAIEFTPYGDPPSRYTVRFSVPALALSPRGMLEPQEDHEVELYCHLEYPRRPPVVTWRTPIFHPNVLPPERGGAVCLGLWSPSQGLADVCRRLVRMAGYELVNPDDPLNRDAVAWFAERDSNEREHAWT